MWLRAPEVVEDVLWEGMLEPETEEAVERTRRELGTRGEQVDFQNEIRNLPIISIGRPEVWSLPVVYPPDKMPDLLKAKLEEADFYLVRTACSFRPTRKTNTLSWARFAVRLLPSSTEQQPLAYDLYPKEVYQEVKHQIKVSLSPTLNFQELQAGVGGVEFGLEYPELQPTISAAGIGEDLVAWDYEEARGIRLQGSKTMHLLVEAPRGMPSSRATLELVADVVVQGLFLPALIRTRKQEAADPMTVQLW
jgi:hypothetical protein